jgi:formylglycine-generating enzyme required for sulfatase activity
VHLPAFEIGSRLVSNAEYAGFIDAGGYRDRRCGCPKAGIG